MKVDLTDLSPVKKQLAIEVDVEEVASETDKVLRSYRQKAKIPGFRQGKAPMELVRKRFAKEAEEDVRERLVSRSFFKATEEKGLRPLGEPTVEELSFEGGQPLSFKTTFEVMPQIELKDYEGVEVRQASAKVGPDEVDQALEEIRGSRVRHVFEEGRAAENGDVVVIDVEGQPAEGDPFERERMPIEIGAQHNLPAFNENLTGVGAGAELKFDVEYPDDYQGPDLAGKTVAFQVKVHEVKRRELPELDDEFAKDLGEFDDLAGLRAKVREDLEARKTHEMERAMREALMDKVLMQNPIVLPEILVEQEVRRRLEDMVRGMMMQGMDPEKAEIDWVEMRKRHEEPAKKMVHAKLILDAVALAHEIEVDDATVDARIKGEAQRIGEPVAKVRARLKEQGGFEPLRNQLVRERSLDYLTTVANIQTEE